MLDWSGRNGAGVKFIKSSSKIVFSETFCKSNFIYLLVPEGRRQQLAL